MKFKNIFVGLFLLVVAFGATELKAGKMSAATISKLEYAVKIAKEPSALTKAEELKYPYSIQDNQLFVNLLLKVSGQEIETTLHKLGCEILSHTKTIYFIKAPASALAHLLESPSIYTIEASQQLKISLDESKKAINAENVVASSITPSGLLAGEGVIVGIVDTGIDFTHPDFYDENGTRILKLWDMLDAEGSGPEGYENYDWGKEYTKSDIDEHPEEITQIDRVGHGTHVAGIAAGGGKDKSEFRGVAYNSDLIVVKVMRREDKETFTDGDIIAACDYVSNEAKKLGKPLVVNLSLGTMLGPHDGKSLLSQAISELTEPGVIFSVAAGNEGDLPIHTGGFVDEGVTVEFPIIPQNLCELMEEVSDICDMPDAFLTGIDMWYSDNAVDSVYLVAYDLMSIVAFNEIKISAIHAFPLDTSIGNFTFISDDGLPLAYINYISESSLYQDNGTGNLAFYIHNAGDPSIVINNYIWSVAIKTKNKGSIDAWAGIPMLAQMPFTGLLGQTTFVGDTKMLVGSPADADSAISVGSFITKNSWVDMFGTQQQLDYEVGNISSFSSPGPSRDGRILPLISAPGQIIFSTKSKDFNIDEENVLEGEKYCGLNGTSMATPHVTGAIALMLQVNPKLCYSDIVDVFSHTALRDDFTGEERNNFFGFGKIDVQAAINYLTAQSGVKYVNINDVKVYPNPATNHINFDLNSAIDVSNFKFTIYNSLGEKVSKDFSYNISGSQLSLNIASLASGVYNVECWNGNSIAKFRFAVK